MNIEELNTQLDYLKETKSLIKEQLVAKGQSVDDNTTFREYADKVENILTAPTKPLGVQVYKRIELLDDQPDLINYYVQGVQTGEFANLNSYQIRFVYIDNVTEMPKINVLQIIDTNPALINLGSPKRYYFGPDYTQAFIQVASSLGMYESLVGAFLETHNLTEEQLLQLNGWYVNEDDTLVSTTHPIFEHTNINWAVKVTVQEYLMDDWGIDNVLDFIDLDTTNLNILLTREDNSNDALDYVEDINGDFLRNCTANEYQVAEGYTAFFHNGKVNGKYIPKCYIFSQPNLAGTYTYENMCCYPIDEGSSYIDRYEWKTEQQNLLDSHPGLFEIYSRLCGLSYKYDTDDEIISIINSISVSDLNALYTFVAIKGTGWLYLRGGTPGAKIVGSNLDQQGNFLIHIITSYDNSVGNIEVILNATREMIQDQFTILSFNVNSIKRYSSTYDATVTESKIVAGYTAYANGQKITGTMHHTMLTAQSEDEYADMQITYSPNSQTLEINQVYADSTNGPYNLFYGSEFLNYGDEDPDWLRLTNMPVDKLITAIGLTADKIKQGETILGITGTAQTIKTYATQQDMEQALNDGEIESGDFVLCENLYTFYIAETNTETGNTDLIRLIRESETMSPQEYTDANDIADEILGD